MRAPAAPVWTVRTVQRTGTSGVGAPLGALAAGIGPAGPWRSAAKTDTSGMIISPSSGRPMARVRPCSHNDAVRSQIQEANLVLVVASHASAVSDWVGRELGFARAHDKPVVPFLI